MTNGFEGGNYQWNENAQDVTPWHQMTGVFKDDSVIGFFQRHPKMIFFLFKKLELLIYGTVARLAFELDMGIKENSKAIYDKFVTKTFETTFDPMVCNAIELEGDHFLAHILETSEAEIKQMQQHNHNMALSHGYYHETQTPNGTAYHTPWGITHQTGQDQYGNPQWNYQANTQNTYGQQGWPPQPPGGMPNPHQQRGGLASSLIGSFLMM